MWRNLLVVGFEHPMPEYTTIECIYKNLAPAMWTLDYRIIVNVDNSVPIE
jgi:hypothetical protein